MKNVQLHLNSICHPFPLNIMRKILLQIPATLLLVGSALAQSMVGIHWETGDLYSVDAATGAASYMSSTGHIYGSGFETAPDGTLYMFTATSSAALYTVDAATGSTTLVGNLNAGFIFEGGMAFSPNGLAYGTNQGNSGNPYLFSVDLNTGQGTIIGHMGQDHDINGLSWRSDGMLVGIDRSTNSLVSINPTTGALSVIFGLTPTLGAVGGMAVRSDTYHFSTSGPSGSIPGSNELWTIDPYSGVHSLVGSLGVTGMGISGLATLDDGLQLSSSGSPGGNMSFTVTGNTPFGPLAYLYAAGTGSHTRTNPFTGNSITTGLSSVKFTIAAVVPASASGEYTYSSIVPAAAAGLIYVQAVDVTKDGLSNVIGL